MLLTGATTRYLYYHAYSVAVFVRMRGALAVVVRRRAVGADDAWLDTLPWRR